MRLLLTSLLLTCFALSILAQKKHKWPVFEETPGYPQSGWVISPLLTNVFGSKTDPFSVTATDTLGQMITHDGNMYTRSELGLGLEVGRFHIIPAGIIFNNLDYTLSYRQFIFGQRFEGNETTTSIQNGVFQDKTKKTFAYKQHNISVNINFNAVVPFNGLRFLYPTLGARMDYDVGNQELEYQASEYFYAHQPEKLNAWIYAKVGFGMKFGTNWFFVPTVEYSWLHLNDMNSIKSFVPVYNTGQHPVTVSLKLLWHKPKRLKGCDIKPDEVDLEKTKRKKGKVRLF